MHDGQYPGDSRASSQRGITVVMLALFIVVIFAFAALAVDLGVLYTARTSAQHAADAAALAGAWTFLTPGATQPNAANDAAITVAGQNKILGEAVVITGADINVDQPNRRVTVTVPRLGANGIETFFARVIGWNSVDVQTRATAEAAEEGSASHCLKPVFIPNTILSTTDPAVTCAAPIATRQVIFGPDSQYSTWFKSVATSEYGSQMKIRPSNPINALEPGQFYSLDFGSGANTYRCTWGQCLNYCDVDTTAVVCGQPYPLKTGDMVGPTKQGVDDLTVGNDTYGTVVDPNTGLYTFYLGGNTSMPSSTSQQVVVAPVWDNCAQSISPGYHGQKVTVAGFLTIFVEGMQGGKGGQSVVARLLRATECPAPGGGAGGGGAGTPSAGPLGIPVRLVQTPVTP